MVRSGDLLWNLAVLWVLFSAIVKGTYKGRKLLEEKAAAAEENAEAEALRRQLVEARLNTMQAQVEPHFLFNTLASIDHLIETDPKRASQMQKNLIALLRATMPTMREAQGPAKRARPAPRAGRGAAVPGNPAGAHGGAAEHRDQRARRPALGRVPAHDHSRPGRKRHQARPGAQARRRVTCG